MDAFSNFKLKLDAALRDSVRAQLFFQDPQYFQGGLNFISFQVEIGATRCTLISPDCNAVLKFTYDEDARNDPCERECDCFDRARGDGVDMYFAEAKYAGRYTYRGEGYPARIFWEESFDLQNDSEEELRKIASEYEKRTISISIDMYEYPKAEPVDLYSYTPSQDTTILKCSPLVERNEKVGAMFLEEYGEEEFAHLTDFLLWNEINDLHGDNIGRLEDGRLVLIDYAGYYSEEDGESD